MNNYQIIDDKVPMALVVFKSALENIEIRSAWFNDMKNNEYSPMHKHTGILSGVLYLKIPEYSPSRKNKGTDGAITFIGNTSPNDGLFTNPQFSVSPKVGDIFIFPSTLRHQVYPFRTENGKGIRRTMSFNVNDRIMVI